MEKQDDLTLMKPRSYRRVLMAGFRLYTGNFRRLFKASWQMALLYALSCGALGTLTAIKIPELSLALQQQLASTQGIMAETLREYMLTLLGIPALVVLAVATLSLASAPILSKLKEHKETGTITTPPHWFTASPHLMGRTLKGELLTLLVSIPLLIVAPFALPLWYVMTKYIMEPSTGYWTTLRKGYGRGMGHWGSLFLVYFLTVLFILLSGMIVMLPANILFLANYRAQMGVLIGDPLGMPSYMIPMTFITFVLCSFLYFYVCLPLLINGYYAYGSIEAKKLEHEQQQLNLQ